MHMKSVGEAMAIGRTFKESLQKCLRSLESAAAAWAATANPGASARKSMASASSSSATPLRAGFSIEEIFNLTKIDRWFVVQIKEIVDFEEELAGVKNRTRHSNSPH